MTYELTMAIINLIGTLAILFTLIFGKKIVNLLDKREEKKKEEKWKRDFYLRKYYGNKEKERA